MKRKNRPMLITNNGFFEPLNAIKVLNKYRADFITMSLNDIENFQLFILWLSVRDRYSAIKQEVVFDVAESIDLDIVSDWLDELTSNEFSTVSGALYRFVNTAIRKDSDDFDDDNLELMVSFLEVTVEEDDDDE